MGFHSSLVFLYMLVIFIIHCLQSKLYNHCKPPLQKNTANIMCYKSDMFFPSLLWTCMLSIEYHFNNKGFWIFYLKAEEERCSKFAKRSRSVVIYQKMLNSAVFQNSVTPRWNSQSETFCLPLNPCQGRWQDCELEEVLYYNWDLG